jgi:GNAT superfamily N-acetyltransferase
MAREQIALDEITVRLAEPADLDLRMKIMGEAAAWLVAKGIDQWPSPPNVHWRRRAAADIEAGQVYLAFRDGEALGTARIVWSDPYWKDVPREAGYIHGLAIRSHLHGRDLGAVLLRWAEEHIRGQGRTLARLDCAVDNGRLRRYYEELGYAYRRQVRDRDYSAALYEKRLGTVSIRNHSSM